MGFSRFPRGAFSLAALLSCVWCAFPAYAQDSDGDGIDDSADNCPTVPNPDQINQDGDGMGDACDDCIDTPTPPAPCVDCNGNRYSDLDDIYNRRSPDCNDNWIPDECEIDVNSTAPGGPFFCTENCDPDCNNNGVPDSGADCDPDCDGDTIPNDCDDDDDDDGISDVDDDDRDGDGMPNDWEQSYGLDPDDCEDDGLDADTDGLINVLEYQIGTLPNNPDTDGDAMPDGWEVVNGFDPLVWDVDIETDGDGFYDSIEIYLGSDPNEITSVPALQDGKYRKGETTFLSRLVRKHRTGDTVSPTGGGVLDSPNVWGADNLSMFDHDGRLYFILGDPQGLNASTGGTVYLHGAMAWTDRIVPEKGIHLEHSRHWVTQTVGDEGWDRDENGYPDARDITAPYQGHVNWRRNNTGGIVIDLPGGGERIFFGTYAYYPSYSDTQAVVFVYSDDGLATEAEPDAGLVLWDKADGGNGDLPPDPRYGYVMRAHKGFAYVMLPRRRFDGLGWSYVDVVLLRASIADLQKAADEMALADWKYLVSVDGVSGEATWSDSGLLRGQVSHGTMSHPDTYIPSVPFNTAPSVVNSVIWNPYMNRWVALNVDGILWEAREIWGPYAQVTRFSRYSTYDTYTHEMLLGNNGEDITYASCTIGVGSVYGSWLFKAHMEEHLSIALSRKSAIQGDDITISVVNRTGGQPAADPVVTVDGNPAILVSSQGDLYEFSYQLTGSENGGHAGVVDVEARLAVQDFPEAYRAVRDAALVVNQVNDLQCAITSHAEGETVSGVVLIEVDAAYSGSPPDLGSGRPEVRVLKVELRNADPGGEHVCDADVHPPYALELDTWRYENGPHALKVTAFDTLDRRSEATITLNIDNADAQDVDGNWMIDGDMEDADTQAWAAFNGGQLSKVSDGSQRSGVRSLLILNEPDVIDWRGVEQTVTGLAGGEPLRFTAWVSLISSVPAALASRWWDSEIRWTLLREDGQPLQSETVNPYRFFRKLLYEFDNPAGNTSITVRFEIRDLNPKAPRIEAVIDDIVLRDLSYPIVEDPTGLEVAPDGDANILTWSRADDFNVEYSYVFRRLLADEQDPYAKIGEVRASSASYVDEALAGHPGSDYVYRVASVDCMGAYEAPVRPTLIGAVSRKEHGSGAGPIDIDVSTGATESRSAQLGTTDPNELRIIATFDVPVDLLGGPNDVTSDLGSVVAVSPGTAPHVLEITVGNLPFVAQVNLTFDGVVSAAYPYAGYGCLSTLCVAVCVGDYDDSAVVSFVDFSQVKLVGYMNQLVTDVDLARADFDCGGRPSFMDFAKVKGSGLLNQHVARCHPAIRP